MTSADTIPAHATTLMTWLEANAPVQLSDMVLFEIWRDTDLEDIQIVAALDWLTITGEVVRSNDSLRCEVRIRI